MAAATTAQTVNPDIAAQLSTALASLREAIREAAHLVDEQYWSHEWAVFAQSPDRTTAISLQLVLGGHQGMLHDGYTDAVASRAGSLATEARAAFGYGYTDADAQQALVHADRAKADLRALVAAVQRQLAAREATSCRYCGGPPTRGCCSECV